MSHHGYLINISIWKYVQLSWGLCQNIFLFQGFYLLQIHFYLLFLSFIYKHSSLNKVMCTLWWCDMVTTKINPWLMPINYNGTYSSKKQWMHCREWIDTGKKCSNEYLKRNVIKGSVYYCVFTSQTPSTRVKIHQPLLSQISLQAAFFIGKVLVKG